MDPLSALSLAGVIVQFVEVGFKIFHETQEVAAVGSSVSVRDLKSISNDVIDISNGIESHVKVVLASSRSLCPEEQAVVDIAFQCQKIAKDLQVALGKLTRPGQKSDSWTNIKIALRTTERDSQQQEDWDRQEKTATNRHEEVLAAILTARDGSSRTLVSPNYSEDFTRSMAHLGTIQTTTKYTESGEEVICVSNNDFRKNFGSILNALHYRTIAHRQASIRPAHAKTFQWIWTEPSRGENNWDSVRDFLAKGNGCYWISGKAGSGKSTLMKYMQDQKIFAELLDSWKSTSELIVASFYFWYAGNALQRSQLGLLRSLLLAVLSRRQEMIPIVFPHLYRCMLSSQVKAVIEFDFTELSEAFLTLLQCMPPNLKICFVIDGIDEYQGNHREICEFISRLSVFESVKLLVSSRPIPACVQYFSLYPKLHLQDLTRGDIIQYVQDMLVGHPTLRKLNHFEKGATAKIVHNVTSKAAGVLLWVILVVNRLLIGLQDYDSLLDLLKKIDELPPDLEKLYEYMLGSMDRVHRTQGSKLLQIVLRSTQIQADNPMTLLQLSFAEEEDYEHSIKEMRSMLEDQEEEWRCEAMEGRMRSRCCGLIEAQTMPTQDKIAKPKTVGFLHRTVVEFLQDSKIWPLITTLTKDTNFNAESALLCSCLQEVRARPVKHKLGQDLSFDSFLRLLSYTEHLNRKGKSSMGSRCLYSALETMHIHWHNPSVFKTPQAEYQAVTGVISRGLQLTQLDENFKVLFSAAVHCPSRDLTLMRKTLGGHLAADQLAATMLLLFVDEAYPPLKVILARNILEFEQSMTAPVEVPTPMTSAWCQHWEGATKSEDENLWTLWEFLLHFLYSISSTRNLASVISTIVPETIVDLISTFVTKGANVRQRISLIKPADRGHAVHKYSALAIIHEFLSTVWTARMLAKQTSSTALLSPSSTAPPKVVFATKAAALEAQMQSKGATIWAQVTLQTIRSAQPTVKTPRRRAVGLLVDGKATNSSTRKQQATSLDNAKIGEDDRPKHAIAPVPSNPKSNSNSATASPEPQVSPWQAFLHEHNEESVTAARIQATTKQEQSFREKRWVSTPRAFRAALLDQNEQDLVRKLTATVLSERERRQVTASVCRLDLERQARIFECVRAQGATSNGSR
ncbi:MAG: hypothetical protein Q9167_003634 [Letrouitia subvulpina]